MPDRILVTYQQAASTCVLPCRFVGWDRSGALVVEVDHVDPKTHTYTTAARRLPREWAPRITGELTDEEWAELFEVPTETEDQFFREMVP